MNDTPLGKVVEIRMESDRDILKNFTPEQRAIRDEWFAFRNANMRFSVEDMRRQSEQLEKMMEKLFG